jgi:hypothetical protein
MARYGNDDLKKISDEFVDARGASEVDVEVVGDANNVSPLLLVETLNKGSGAYTLVPLAQALFAKKSLIFRRGGHVVCKLVCPDNANFDDLFSPYPDLLEPLLKTAYGIMLKKLTPLSANCTDAGNSPEAAVTAVKEQPKT